VKARRIPLDAEPNPAGNVTLDADSTAHVWSGADLDRLRAGNNRLIYMPHHATCPEFEALGPRRRARPPSEGAL